MIKPYISKNNITIYQGCALEVLKEMEDKSVDMCMTSPPYWGLRDYGIEGQLGLEPTYQEYIEKLVAIFDEVKRVLKDTGSCWVVIGDTYSNNSSVQEKGRQGFGNDKVGMRNNKQLQEKTLIGIPERFAISMTGERYKCYCGWSGNKSQTKFAGDYYCPVCGDLTEKHNGWIRRNTVIWYKSNCMPSSANDRFTVDFEYLYFFTKKPQYYFEQQFEPAQDWGTRDRTNFRSGTTDPKLKHHGLENGNFADNGRNKRCVWQLSTEPCPDAHFATYPQKLCETPIKAGCPSHICKTCGKAREKIMEPTEEYAKHLGKSWHDHKNDSTMGFGQQTRGFSSRKGDVSNIQRYKNKGYTDCGCNAGFEGGVVMDPFMGSGTTLKVARELGRKGIGIELSEKYIEMAIKRINLEQTLLEFNHG